MTTQTSHQNPDTNVERTSKPLFPLMGRTVEAARAYIKRVDDIDVSEQTMQEAIIKGLESAGYEVWR